MCIITLEDKNSDLDISKTKIFARHTKPGFQVIVYGMSIRTSTHAAMILPIPVKPDSGEDAVRFIDMRSPCVIFKPELLFRDNDIPSFLPVESHDLFENIPDFFGELSENCYPEYQVDNDIFSSLLNNSFGSSSLKVHDVGDYEASYIPSKTDFTRIDPRFRLETEIWDNLPDYSNYGFVVFQLKTSSKPDRDSVIPPMAFEFPTAEQKKLFYPTIHVHGDGYHNLAGFDHVLYCQRDEARSEFKYQRDLLKQNIPTPAQEIKFKGYTWYLRSLKKVSHLIHHSIHKGVLDPDKKIFGMTLEGEYLNKDIFLGEVGG